ncbi:hypothetical protein JTB14_034423 [Gonioctena quinquepunctata]|nr:hypothetical protein JTB14_034423 [Gonioctena quinquepunctata]
MVSAVGTQNESSSSSPIRKVRPYWQRPISDVLSVTSPTLKRPREISCKDKNGKPSDEMSIAASQKNPLPSPERKQSSSTALSTLLERNGWIPKKHKSKNVSPRKKQIEEAGTSGCSSKVVNPFAKMSPAKKSRTSDDTFVEDPSIILKEENRFDEGPEPQLSDDDVEFLVTEDPPVVVLESVVETELSPDLLEKLPQNSNRFPDSHSDESEKACVSTRPNRPELENDSTDDELISPVTKKSCRSKIVEKVPTKIPTRQKCGKRKHEKYTKQLIQNNMKELNQFCVNCFRYYKDVEGHMKKKHKTMPKKLIRCKKCGLDYYFTPFIDFHKCQKK